MSNLLGWPFGLLLSFIASIVGVLGKIMVKLSYRSHLMPKSMEARLWWGGGMTLIAFVNPVLCITAYKFAPQSLLAPIGGMCVVWNTLLSPWLLSEALRARDMIAAALIFVGCVIVGAVGSHETHDIPLSELSSHFTSAPFLVYSACLVIYLAILCRQAYPAFCYVWNEKDVSYSHETMSCRVALSSISGCLSGQLFLMCSLLRLAHNPLKDVLSTPLVYIIGVSAFTLAVLGLYLMNTALKLYDALLVIYIYEATLIMSGAISGICFFGDMTSLSSWHWIVYAVGVALIVFGIIILANGSRNSPSAPFIEDLHAVKQTLL